MARKSKSVRELDADADTPEELFSTESAPADTAPTTGTSEPPASSESTPGSEAAPVEPSGEPKQATPADGTASDQVPQPGQEPQTPPMYEFGGQKYTRDQLSDEKLRDIEQTLRQFPHVQRLHAEDKRLIDALKAENERFRAAQGGAVSPAPSATAPATPAQVTPEEWMRERQAKVQALVKAGWLSQDSVDLTPDIAAMLAGMAEAYFDIARRNDEFEQRVVETYEKSVRPLIRGTEEAAEFQQVTGYLNQLDAALAEIGESGSHYEGLKDKLNRAKFVQHLAQNIDPDLSRINRDFLASQYIAYDQAAIIDKIAKAAAAGSARPATPVVQANVTGEGGSPRQAHVNQQNADIAAVFSKG